MIAIVIGMIVAQAGSQVALAPFTGTWIIDTSQDEFGGHPVSRIIKNGRYRCGNCVTTVDVPTDGLFHTFKGGQDFDAVAVRIQGPRKVEYRYRKNGKLAETVTEEVSSTGDVLTWRTTNLTAPSGRPDVSEGQRARVGAAKPGEHPVSGEWRQLAGAKEATAALTITIRTDGERVTITQPNGRQVSALLGGPGAPIAGDQAGRLFRIETAPPRALRTTTAIDGKDVQTGLMTLAEDGATLNYEVRDLTLGQTIRFVAKRQ